MHTAMYANSCARAISHSLDFDAWQLQRCCTSAVSNLCVGGPQSESDSVHDTAVRDVLVLGIDFPDDDDDDDLHRNMLEFTVLLTVHLCTFFFK